jgi:superfamily II RNA helicase
MAAPRLEAYIPETGFRQPDDALEAFLRWVTDSGITLYAHQEEAVLELFAGNHVILDAPTGSGKSLVALALHFKTFAELGKSFYTAPIKALVSEKFFALCKLFGAEHVGMMTGDGAINRDAPIICCTAEILANLALRQGEGAKVDTVVMDEFHYYADPDRGMAWQLPLLTLPRTTFLLMSATLGDTTRIREDLELRTQQKVAEVRGAHRPVPLTFKYSMKPISEAIQDLVRSARCPIYVVHFTQQAAAEQAQALMSLDWCTKEEKKAILEAVKGFRFTSPFGSTIRRYVLHGVGLHHAGLLPRYRLLVERLAQQGLLKVICGTDTLGVGINVPIRTVLFTQLCKFDGEKVGILKVRDFKQIAGRAGRAGFDTEGTVLVQAPEHIIENARLEAKFADDPKKRKKMVKAQPPTRGYKHWDEETMKQLIERPPEALESRFTVDHGRLLMVMQHAIETHGDARPGVDAMVRLIDQSHATANEKVALKAKVETLVDGLRRAKVAAEDQGKLVLDPTLPRDFSLHHSLSLFLIEALSTVDAKKEDAAYDHLTWVEAILESPRQVLLAQAHKARGEAIHALKAAGVPYEERTEAIEHISWPKPNAELIYAIFNAYVEAHPWVSGEDIRPKSVARQMLEGFTSFADYIKDLDLQRSEGVLLRYLTDVYKAMVQNVPPEFHGELWTDLVARLRATLAIVDESLLMEWETLLAGADGKKGPVVLDISADRKLFFARIRAELHALVAALSKGDFETAAAALHADPDEPWTPQHLDEALAPFVIEHGAVAFDHRARLAAHTKIEAIGAHRWRVSQAILPPAPRAVEHEFDEDEGEVDAWQIEGEVDLTADTNPEGPLLRLRRIGP